MANYCIADHEVGLVFHGERLECILEPGTHRVSSGLWPSQRRRVEVIDRLQTRFEHPHLYRVLAHKPLRELLEVVSVASHQRALVWVDGQLLTLLSPGRYAFWKAPRDVKVELLDTLKAVLDHPLSEKLLEHPEIREAVEVVELSDDERALVWRDNRLATILGPGRHALWRREPQFTVERFDIAKRQLEHPRVEAVLGHSLRKTFLEFVRVSPYERCLLIDGRQITAVLEPGKYLFWRPADGLETLPVDLREQVHEVAAQEIMTQDKVTLRVTMLVTFRVEDVVKAATVVQQYAETLYREAQLALRAAVGTRTVDALLADKAAIGTEVHEALQQRAAEFGVAVRSVGVRDISLPGDMKEILNQVITAEKRAQANIIKRREETAAARSQANTARLLADNPVLARMKELEMLQEILSGTDTTIVLGPDDIAKQVRSLVAAQDAD